jgi:hypothetical protein
MAKRPDIEWKVLDNEPIVQLEENLWRVEGALPKMALRRCMVVARVASGDLVIHNAIALDEAGMEELEGLGAPRWMIVPNGWHRLDAARFKARYPDIEVVCPRGSRKNVEKMVPVDTTYDAFDPGDDTVSLQHLDGVKEAEGVMTARSEAGVTLVFNDAIFNLEHGKGLFWFIYGRLLGNAGKPKVTTISRWVMVKDKKAFKAHLTRLADTPELKRIIVAHGKLIESDAAGVLRKVAEAL